jgi:hypothetical protein
LAAVTGLPDPAQRAWGAASCTIAFARTVTAYAFLRDGLLGDESDTGSKPVFRVNRKINASFSNIEVFYEF